MAWGVEEACHDVMAITYISLIRQEKAATAAMAVAQIQNNVNGGCRASV